MTYNLHNGFNTDGRLDLESLAEVIEASGAQVVALQEVSRGWLINGSVDMLSWLSQRLNMAPISGPTADLQWGNAILTRFPVAKVHLGSLPPDSLLIRRGYILAEIRTGAGNLRVIATHLHHIREGGQIREQQVPVLIAAWEGAPRTLIMGDFNATPSDPEIQMLYQAGLLDISAEIGPLPHYTYYSAYPDHQIDYIWTSPDLRFSDFEIPQTTASDHLPLVTTIRLP
jgi:endonuclease/exonuclease/phosphatase family metal-dependent hydrolase